MKLSKEDKEKEHLCYMLYSEGTKRTYVGYTVNLQRRIRQHNGEIVGGAKRTRRGRPWTPVLTVSGFPDQVEALRFEWRCHHPTKFIRKGEKPIRGHGFEGRIRSICSILEMEKVCSKATCLNDLSLQINWLYPKPEPDFLVEFRLRKFDFKVKGENESPKGEDEENG